MKLLVYLLGISITFSVSSPSWAKQAPSDTSGAFFSTTVEDDIDADISDVFNFTAAEGVLPKVLHNHGIIPGVSHTQVLQIPSWDEPGALRIVYLNDGNTAHEEITAFIRPGFFAYRVSQFTGMMGHLASDAQGQWWFELRNGKTHVRWTYTFHSKGGVTGSILKCIVLPNFHGYMEDALKRIKNAVESAN